MKESEYMNKIKIVAAIALFLISLTGCKKSQEELAKELEDQKNKQLLIALIRFINLVEMVLHF